MGAQVVHVEQPLLEPAHHPFGLFGLEGFLRLFNKGDDIAHAQNAARDPAGFKGFQHVQLFAQAHKADRLAGNRPHRQRRTAAAVAVHPGQDHAGDTDFCVKLGRDIDRVLPGQPVHHQQRLARRRHITHSGSLGDQVSVNVQTACGIKDIDVISAQGRLRFRPPRNRHRILALDDRQGIDANLHSQNRQLFHRGGAVHVERAHQHALALTLFQPPGQFGGGCGLARPLQANHQDRRGRVVDFQHTRVTVAGQHMDQLVMDDLDDLLARGDGFGDGLSGGFFLHGCNEIAGNGQTDISLEQGHPHFA